MLPTYHWDRLRSQTESASRVGLQWQCFWLALALAVVVVVVWLCLARLVNDWLLCLSLRGGTVPAQESVQQASKLCSASRPSSVYSSRQGGSTTTTTTTIRQAASSSLSQLAPSDLQASTRESRSSTRHEYVFQISVVGWFGVCVSISVPEGGQQLCHVTLVPSYKSSRCSSHACGHPNSSLCVYIYKYIYPPQFSVVPYYQGDGSPG